MDALAAGVRDAAAPAPEPATVLVVDDEESVRTSLSRLLRAAGFSVETYGSAQEFMARPARAPAPACLMLDVRMPGFSGLQLQERLNGAAAAMPIVFMTGYADVPTSVRAIRSGALDVLEKPVPEDVLLAAVESALARSREHLAEQRHLCELQRRYATLTPRERQVFALVVSGLLNKQVGGELGTTEKTVKVHRARVMEKMRAQSLPDLVRMAAALGIDASAPR